MLTLRPDFRGKGRRTSNLPTIGQHREDRWLQGGQDEEHLQKGKEKRGQSGLSVHGAKGQLAHCRACPAAVHLASL